MKRINRKSGIADHWILFLECTGLILLVFGIYLFQIRPFHINNDQMFQYPVFYQEWLRLIRDCFAGKGLPLYSWRMFLGTDFYSAMAYYVTGDVFLPLFFVMDIEPALLVETVLCFYISCFALYAWIRRCGVSSHPARFVSLLYAFGGWGMLYIGQYMFHRFYAFLPLLPLCAEVYFKNKKLWPTALVTCLLFVTNYYLMWPACFFLLGYCLVRERERGVSRRQFWIDAGKLLSAVVCGTLLSGVILVPAAVYVLHNPRVGAVNNTGLFWPLKVYAGWILSFTTAPFPVYTGFANLYQLNDNGYGYWYTVFVTILPLVLSLAWMTKKEHRGWLIFLGFLTAGCIFKPISVILHGFSDPSMRWTFILQLLLLYGCARSMEDAGTNAGSVSNDEQHIWLGYELLCVTAVALTVMIMGTGREYLPHYASILVCFLLAAGQWVLYRNRKQNLAMILAVLEVGGYSAFMQVCFFHDVVFDDYRLSSESFAYLLDTEEDMLFRVYIPIDEVMPGYPNLNSSLRYGYLSERTYNSLYDTATNPFLSLMGISEHRIDITDPDALNLLGTRLYLTEDPSKLPAGYDFEYVTTLEDSLSVYRNRSACSFGYAGESVGTMSETTNVKDLVRNVYADEPMDTASYEQCVYTPFVTEIQTTDYLRGSIDLSSDNILFLPVPYNKGWKVTVDGIPSEILSVNGGFLGVPLSAGTHTVEFNFMSPGLKAGIACSALGALCFLILAVLERKDRSKGKKE